MFTGIIQALGTIADSQPQGGDLRLYIQTGKLPLADVQLGDSIATSGVCLTVVELPGDGFWADVSGETLRLTTLGEKGVGDCVNLEKSLTPTTALGGHIVSGHVDGVGWVVSITQDARSWVYDIESPPELAHYIARKGSICVDGTSLTVNAVDGCRFSLNIIPQTFEETVFSDYQVGSRVNLEVDLIARYLERLALRDTLSEGHGLSIQSEQAADD